MLRECGFKEGNLWDGATGMSLEMLADVIGKSEFGWPTGGG